MRKLFALLLLGAGLQPLFSQQNHPAILCGNEIFHHIIRERYPELQQAFDATFEQAKAAGQQTQERSPLNINVVVHIVWKNEEENLADSVVQSQIQVLNEDFNRQNADTANLRFFFQPVAGNADIHFNLAQIVRVETSTEFSLDLLSGEIFTELKSGATGGSDAWDTGKYLNIWVCKIQPTTIFGLPVGQILGVAFPPNGLSNWPDQSGAPTPDQDGVVIDFRAFGRNNPNPLENPGGGGNLDVRGRTPVHEVGHYLGLRHIWGDGGSLIGPNDCNQSDGVDDTPYANAQSEFDCNTTKNTCNKVEPFYQSDMPDLVENYMDYSSESCMNMFTKGQVEIMRNVLTGPRAGLINSSPVRNPETSVQVSLQPNPFGQQTTAIIQVPRAATATVKVWSTDGQLLLNVPGRPLTEGTNRLPLDLQGLPNGLYFLEINFEGQRVIRKLCKQ